MKNFTNKKAPISYIDVLDQMTDELEPAEQQINLLQQAVSKLEDIKVLFEKVYVKGEGTTSEWPWIDNKQLEKLLGLHERTLQTWRENGTLNFSRIGKKIFYHKREIEQLLWSKFSREVKL